MLIEAVVLVGVAGVMPLGLRHSRRWFAAAAAVVLAMAVPVGVASAVLASTWFVVALSVLAVEMRRLMAIPPPAEVLRRAEQAAPLVASGFAAVAGVAFAASRGGLELFGIGEPIVQLTAVHFTYAGVGAVMLAAATVERFPRAGTVALAVTVVAPPVVATGFLVQHPLPQVGGAVLMSCGVLTTAALQLREAMSRRPRPAWLVVSGLAPWIPMGLAVTWAASLYWPVPALSIPDMARTHGVMNAVFVLAGLWSRRAGDPQVDLGLGGSGSRPLAAR